jgi:hypothetical protein
MRLAIGLIAILLLAVAAPSTPAAAQSRVFVAGQGSDGNPCTFAAPCRTFQHAHDVLAAGGEIDVLDPAGYGSVNITKAISIQGHGFSGISVGSGGTGITINAPFNAAVNLNGLLIEGSGVGQNGILFNQGKSLVVAKCISRNMTGNGLFFTSFSSDAQTLSVSDSIFSQNASDGILVGTHFSGSINATIERVALYGNANAGLSVVGSSGTGALNVAVTDSVASNNVNGSNASGILATSAASQSATKIMLTRVTAAGNEGGLVVIGPNLTVRLAESTLSGNGAGFFVTNASVLSYGDNYIDGNGPNTGSLTAATKQ